MAGLDDVRIHRTETEAADSASARNRLRAVIVVTAVLLLAGAGYWFFLREPAADNVRVRTETEERVEPRPPVERPPAEPGEDIALPPLAESDALVRDLVSKLSSHPRVAAWLATDGLIRNFTVVVTNIAEGRSPARHLKRVGLEGEFQVSGVEEGVGQAAGAPALVIDPRSYRRYDTHAAAVAGIDPRGAARLYATLKPRVQEAYAELGAPHGDFDRSLERAIVHLLQTPIVEGDVGVRPAPVSYAYSDPALESLSSAQRQFLRMGSYNVRIVQGKLREVAPHLGIPQSALPAERVRRGR